MIFLAASLTIEQSIFLITNLNKVAFYPMSCLCEKTFIKVKNMKDIWNEVIY